MSEIRDDRGGGRLGPQRRYRIAGSAAGLDDHVEDLAAGYALDALDAEDRARVERHVRRCPACANLLAEERRVVALLPLAAAPAAPPPDVKVALFARIAHAQRAATVEAPASLALPPTLTIPSSRPAPRTAGEAPAAVVPAPWVDPRPERSSWLGRIGAFATVPLLLALVLTGGWAFQLQDRVSQSTGQVQNLEATLANFGAATRLPLFSPETAGEQGQLVIGSDQRQGILKMQLVPDPNRSYKLIGVREGQVVPVADLELNDQGNSGVFTSELPFDEYEQVEVQAEPLGSDAGSANTVLSGDPNGAIGSGDPTSNSGAP